MAIDINASRREHPVRCLWYKKVSVNNMKLIPEAVPEGVIYVKDKIPYAEHTELVNGIAQQIVKTLTIETNDYCPGISANDYILYDGDLWRINAVRVSDDLCKNKFYSCRPFLVNEIELRK